MAKKTLLLISSYSEDEAFAAEVSNVAGLDLAVEPDPVEASKLMSDGEVAVTFFDSPSEGDYKIFEDAIERNVGMYSDHVNSNRFHFISAVDLQEVNYLFKSPLFGQYISRSYGDPKIAGHRYGAFVKASLGERVFGLKNLFIENAKIQTVKFANTNQKQQGVEAVKNYLMAAQFKSRMATVIANAVDELIMNAMYDAAVDELGKQLYLSTPRDTPIELKDKAEVEMHVGFDGTYVGIMAVDRFGSLDKMRLLNHISKRYKEEEYKANTAVAGAGIGLATIFRSGGSLLFSSEAQTRTEVTAFFRRTSNFREFKDQFRFIATQFYF